MKIIEKMMMNHETWRLYIKAVNMPVKKYKIDLNCFNPKHETLLKLGDLRIIVGSCKYKVSDFIKEKKKVYFDPNILNDEMFALSLIDGKSNLIIDRRLVMDSMLDSKEIDLFHFCYSRMKPMFQYLWNESNPVDCVNNYFAPGSIDDLKNFAYNKMILQICNVIDK